MLVAMDAKEIGENLEAMRRNKMSQKELGEAMRDRGHKWSQTTVYAIERGDRHIKLDEARDIALLLNVDLGDFFQSSGDVLLARQAQRAAQSLQSHWNTVRGQVLNFRHQQDETREIISECTALAQRSHRPETLMKAAEYAEGSLSVYSIQGAVDRALADYDRENAKADADTSEG